ncbi:MAG: thermonuclease family protein [Deltaproteobacteria bacterium]|nr:thermonuclease family protein [Deltaproteobacteria bacterium]
MARKDISPSAARQNNSPRTAASKKMVTVHPTDKDRYGRIVAHVKLLDGRDLGEELLRAGLAWLEADAKKSRLGL